MMYYYNTDFPYLSFSACKYIYYFLYHQVFSEKRHKMSHFVIYLVFLTRKMGDEPNGPPPEMVDNNLVSNILLLDHLLTILDDEALIAAVNTLTREVVDQTVTRLFSLHSLDTCQRCFSSQGNVVYIVPTAI